MLVGIVVGAGIGLIAGFVRGRVEDWLMRIVEVMLAVPGLLLSLAALAVAGRLPARQITAGAALLPFVIAGFVAAAPLRRYLDAGRLRPALLVVVGMSAVALIVRNLV